MGNLAKTLLKIYLLSLFLAPLAAVTVHAERLAGCQLKQATLSFGMNLQGLHGESCRCEESGKVLCAKGKAKKPKGCTLDKAYVISVGQTVDSVDGCNTCTCEEKAKKPRLVCTYHNSCGP